MRLWHYKLLPHLNSKHLADLHMTCCNLRGKGWGRRNLNINYVFEEPGGFQKLVHYHLTVLAFISKLGWNVNREWLQPYYRGRQLGIPEQRTFVMTPTGDQNFIAHDHAFLLVDIQTLNNRGYNLLEEDVK